MAASSVGMGHTGVWRRAQDGSHTVVFASLGQYWVDIPLLFLRRHTILRAA